MSATLTNTMKHGLVGLGMLLAAIAWATESPLSVSGATTVDAEAAKELFDRGAVFIDVRSHADWEAGRIPGSIHMELNNEYNAEILAQHADFNTPIVIYCNAGSCLRSSIACEQAVNWGYQNVYYYRMGYPEWWSAGYAIE